MANNKKIWIVVILTSIISSVITYSIGIYIPIENGNKLILNRKNVEELISIKDRYSKLMLLEDYIKDNYLEEVDDQELLNGELKGLFNSLNDKYSTYFTKDEFEKYSVQAEGSYDGIGILLGISKTNKLIVIDFTTDNGPAENAGIKIGDEIIEINNVKLESDNKKKAIENFEVAIAEMKGNIGEKICMKVKTNNNGDYLLKSFEVSRDKIEAVSILSQMLNEKIGYIRIIQFDDHASKNFKEQYEELKNAGMERLIIDIRENLGGLVNASVEITDLLVPKKKKIVCIEERNGRKKYHMSMNRPIEEPFVILVNENSASASEIMAGAVKDFKSGLIIGTKTFGKGIVQGLKELEDGSGFKLTISKYYTPLGKSIHQKGIIPNIEVNMVNKNTNIGPSYLNNDIQLKRAIEIISSE